MSEYLLQAKDKSYCEEYWLLLMLRLRWPSIVNYADRNELTKAINNTKYLHLLCGDDDVRGINQLITRFWRAL